jgi:hypothetical protein
MKLNIDNQGILHVRAGFIAPTDLIQRIVDSKPAIYGGCVQASEGDKFSLDLYHEDASGISVSDIQNVLESAKDFPVSMYFGKDIPFDNKDNIQPWPITDADKNPFIALFTEGTINNFDSGEGTEQYRFVSEFLMPKVLEYCDDFEGDLDKIVKKIGSDAFKRDLAPYLGHRAVIHMVPFKGETITLEHNNQLGISADWGFFSNETMLPRLKKEEPKPVEAPKAVGGSRFFGTKTKASVPAVAPPAPEVTPEPAKVEPKPADVATPGNVEKPVTGKADEVTKIAVKPPQWLQKNEDVKAWYTAVNGSFPDAWRKRIPVMVEQSHPVLKFNKIDQLQEYRASQRKQSLQTTTAMPSPTAVKAPVASSTSNDTLPILNAIEMESVLDFVAKHLDGKGREITDPKKMQELEAQLPAFSESVGVTAAEMLNWPVSGVFALAKTEARAAVLMAIEFRNLWRAELEAQGKLKDLLAPKSEAKVETKTEDLGNGSKKTESVAKGSSRFFGRKVG